MPYIHDLPSGQEYHRSRPTAHEMDHQDYADIELLKLLNGGLNRPAEFSSHVEPSYGYDQHVVEDEDSDVSEQQQQPQQQYQLHAVLSEMSSKHQMLIMPAPSPSFDIAMSSPLTVSTTPFHFPPFISDLLHLGLPSPYKMDLDQQDDFTMKRRYPRMSFNGHPYPPVPPDPSTIARPIDDWANEDIPLRRNAHQAHDQTMYAAQPAPLYPQTNMFGLESEPYMHQQQQQQRAWTPPHAQTWSNLPPVEFHAPVLNPRYVHLPERPITPHDTYRYPNSHVDQIYIAPVVPEVSTETINAAFAVWYANQVIGLLVTPGQFRPGVGGASDELWGPTGREKEGWLRVGRSAPDFSKPWGRMGMTQSPVLAPRKVQRRRPDLEPRDPWNVSWAHSLKPTQTFVNFILDMIQRMTISPTALVTAVWFLTGLGLHEGDGPKGAQLRAFLREHRSYEAESVERRVATLGLLLAGKWLDDNSFLTKSWCEVTTIPVKQLDRMERCALADLHFSLHVPVSSWVDHVNKLYASLICKALPDDVDIVVTPIIDDMVTEAREVELNDPQEGSPVLSYDRRPSTEMVHPAAADQAISRDWGSFARYYAHGQNFSPLWNSQGIEVDVEMERAERSVDALVNDEYRMDGEIEEDDEDDEEEFLDYDGAKRWLPSMSELKRSTSLSSDRSFDSLDSHYRADTFPGQGQSYHVPLDILETPVRQRTHSDWSYHSAKSNTSSFDWENSDFLYPIETDKCQKCDHREHRPTTTTMNSGKRHPFAIRHANHDQRFVEPGIAVIPSPSARQAQAKYSSIGSLNASQRSSASSGSSLGHGYGSTSKRWGTRAAQW
ncbi:hypothetical protein IAT40_006475 [Kwoniella sp. CBS 6097]